MSGRAPSSERPHAVPRSASGRVPQWLRDEAEGRAPQHAVPWRAWTTSDAPVGGHHARASRRRPLRGAAAVAALALVLTTTWAVSSGRAVSVIGQLTGLPAPADSRALAPAPGHEEASKPLGTPAPLAATSTSYAVMATASGGHAVAYDPCRPLHYVLRPDGAPAGGDQLIGEAIDRVSAATGLQFVNDGATTEAPSHQRQPYQPRRYGDRWAPVLIAWATPAEDPDLAAGVAGEAGSTPVTSTGSPSVYVTGQVELDGQQLAGDLARPGGANQVRAVIEHELGHLVGLDHVNDPSQLMYPQSTGAVTDYAAGDLTGLARLGHGPCAPGI